MVQWLRKPIAFTCRMIKAVFFDLYNTLVRFEPPRERIQVEAGRDFGLELEPAGVTRGYVEADHLLTKQNARRHVARLSPEEQRAFFARYERLVLRGAGVEADEGLAGRVWERVRRIPYSLALFDDVLPALREVKGRGVATGVISNLYQDMDELCARLGMAPLLDFALSSQSVGAEKPHPLIFQAALQRAGVLPHEAMHVGDQYDGDVAGARGVGIRPILLDRHGLLTAYTDVDRIRSLDEVASYLEG